ncbi:MAG: hypothetical protein ACPF8V_01635 [Luteibaculum sp.]
MKKLLGALTFTSLQFFCFAQKDLALVPRTIELNGWMEERSFLIPKPTEGKSLGQPSSAILYLRFSPAINPKVSAVTFSLNEFKLLTVSPKPGAIEQINLDFSGIAIGKESQTLKISSQLSSTGDPCKDLSTKALWAQLLDSSKITYQALPSQSNMDHEFDSVGQIIVASKDLDYQIAALYASWQIQRSKSLTAPIIAFKEEILPVTNSLFLAPIADIPDELKLGIRDVPLGKDVLRYRVKPADGDSIPGNNSVITAFSAEALRLGIKDMTRSWMNKSEHGERDTTNFIPLKRLNGAFGSISGWGQIKQGFFFSIEDFHTAPDNLFVKLRGKVLDAGEDDRLNLKIWLNGSELTPKEFEASGSLDHTLTLNQELLKDTNYVEIQFVLSGNSGKCIDNGKYFTLYLDPNKSGVEFSVQKEVPSVNWLGQQVLNKGLSLACESELSWAGMQSLQMLLGYLNPGELEIKSSENLSTENFQSSCIYFLEGKESALWNQMAPLFEQFDSTNVLACLLGIPKGSGHTYLLYIDQNLADPFRRDFIEGIFNPSFSQNYSALYLSEGELRSLSAQEVKNSLERKFSFRGKVIIKYLPHFILSLSLLGVVLFIILTIMRVHRNNRSK